MGKFDDMCEGVIKSLLGAAMLAGASASAHGVDQAFLKALANVETRNNPDAVGDVKMKNKAYGKYQIRQPAVDDVNRAFGTSYRAEDGRDPAKADDIASKYLDVLEKSWKRANPGKKPTPIDLARMWNGGPTGYAKENTEDYGRRFAAALSRVKSGK